MSGQEQSPSKQPQRQSGFWILVEEKDYDSLCELVCLFKQETDPTDPTKPIKYSKGREELGATGLRLQVLIQCKNRNASKTWVRQNIYDSNNWSLIQGGQHAAAKHNWNYKIATGRLQFEFGKIQGPGRPMINRPTTRKKQVDHRFMLHLYPWQCKLRDILEYTAPDPKAIYWIYEEIGNTGKTAFFKNYARLRPHTTALVGNGKSSDMYRMVAKVEQREVILCDLHRSDQEHVNYTALQTMKLADGGLVPHVVVFANFQPDVNSMRLDMWKIGRITHDLGLALYKFREHAYYPPVIDFTDMIEIK